MTITSLKKTAAYPFLLTGLIAGGLLALLITHQPAFFGVLPFIGNALPHNSIQTLFYFWIGFYGLMFLFAYPNARSTKALVFISLIPSFLAALPCYWSTCNSSSQFFLIMIFAYTMNALHIHYQSNGCRLSYPTLFYAVWDTFVKLIIAFFFTLFCWIILYLCGALFNFISINFLSTLLSKNWFSVWMTAILISIALMIATKTDQVVHNIRVVLLLVCRYLLIPLAIISIVFLISFLIVRSKQHITFDSQYLFSSIGILCILFLNGVYQDGLAGKIYPFILQWICRIFILVTPLFSLIAFYIIYFHSQNNINTNGFNTQNIFYFINLSLLLIYNLVYAAIAIFPHKQWFKPIERANVILAILLIAVTFITTYPAFVTHFPQPNNVTKKLL